MPHFAPPPDPQDADHIPVLLAEVLNGLQAQPGGRYIDGTVGGGGHTARILSECAPDGQVLAVDADPAAILRVAHLLPQAVAEGRLLLVQGRFEEMAQIAEEQDFGPVDGILLDLGVSSFQLETGERGFSFSQDGPLDMRMDPTAPLSAAEIVNTWPEFDLADLIFRYGEERRSRPIARQLVKNRPISTTLALAEIVEQAVGDAGAAAPTRPPRPFRLCALRSTTNWANWSGYCPWPWICSNPAAGWPSSAFTAWKIAWSSSGCRRRPRILSRIATIPTGAPTARPPWRSSPANPSPPARTNWPPILAADRRSCGWRNG